MDRRIQVQLEEDGGGSTELEGGEWGAWPMLHLNSVSADDR